MIKFEKAEIDKYGMIRILYHNEVIEDGVVKGFTNHKESLHISECENHGYSQIASMFLMKDSYPLPDEEPAISEKNILKGELDAMDIALSQKRVEYLNKVGEIEIDGVVIKKP